MRLVNGWYKADEGKRFVLTEKGKTECASFKYDTVGEPTSEYDYEAVHWSVDSGYEIEVDIPGFQFGLDGYEVVYDNNGYTLSVGNPHCFPIREIAEVYMKNHEWLHPNGDMYIREKKYNGVPLSEMPTYNGKPVRDWKHYFGLDAHKVGDLFTSEVVEWFRDCVPPVSYSRDFIQCGEPHSSRIDENGEGKTTYSTFKRIANDVWEYCGDCFRGENVQNGKELAYV